MNRALGTRKGILDCRGGMRGYVKCLWYCQRVMEGYLPNALVIEAGSRRDLRDCQAPLPALFQRLREVHVLSLKL